MLNENSVIKLFNKDGVKTEEITLTNSAIEAYNEGIDFATSNQSKQAIEAFKKAIEIEPRYINAHYDLGVLYYTLDRREEAQREYEIVLKIQPNDVDALNNL